MSKVPLDCAGCLPTAAGLAAGEAVGEEGEEGDDALRGDVSCLRTVVESCCFDCCWLTLMMALMTVTMPLTMAMKQLVIALTTELNWTVLVECSQYARGGGISYARCDGAHCCGVELG